MRVAMSCLMLAAGTAYAQPAPSARDEAVRYYETQEYARAADAFKRCYQTTQDPACLYGLGQAYRELGDCERARSAYSAFLRTSPGDEQRDKATRNMERCVPAPPPTPVQPVVAPVASEPSPWYRDGLGGGLAIGGLLATAGGVTLAVLDRSARADAEREGRGDGSLQAFEDHMERADRYRLGAIVAGGVGGALLIGAIVRYVTRDGEPARTHVTVSSRAVTFEMRF